MQTTPGSPRHESHEEVWESGEEYGEWEDHQEGPGNSFCSLSPHLIPLTPETLAETFLSAAQCLLSGAWASFSGQIILEPLKYSSQPQPYPTPTLTLEASNSGSLGSSGSGAA